MAKRNLRSKYNFQQFLWVNKYSYQFLKLSDILRLILSVAICSAHLSLTLAYIVRLLLVVLKTVMSKFSILLHFQRFGRKLGSVRKHPKGNRILYLRHVRASTLRLS